MQQVSPPSANLAPLDSTWMPSTILKVVGAAHHAEVKQRDLVCPQQSTSLYSISTPFVLFIPLQKMLKKSLNVKVTRTLFAAVRRVTTSIDTPRWTTSVVFAKHAAKMKERQRNVGFTLDDGMNCLFECSL